MNEMVEQLAAQAGLSGAWAKKALSKTALSKAALSKAAAKAALAKRVMARKASFAGHRLLPNQNLLEEIQPLSDAMPSAGAAIDAPTSGGARVGLKGRLVAPAGKPTKLVFGMRGDRSVAGERFNITGDRVGADRTGETIAGTPRLR
jgi:hypothetical protein